VERAGAPFLLHRSSDRRAWKGRKDGRRKKTTSSHTKRIKHQPYLPLRALFFPPCAPLSALTQRQIEKHFVLLFLSFFLLLGGAKKFNQVAL
jgi:hypothetical protein